MKFSHHRIFKCTCFMPSHYISAINLDVELSFSVFSEFDSMCLNRCIAGLNQ